MNRSRRLKPTVLHVRAQPGSRTRGWLRIDGQIYPCALGRGGVTRFKREGDGATPAGRLPVLSARYRADRMARPATALGLQSIEAGDGWSDDPSDGRYNRPVRLPFAGSHEKLKRADAVYDVIVVLDWNIRRRALRRGSAIFFHIARPDYAPTEGCVAVSAPVMRRILARLGPGAVMQVD